MGSSSAVVLYPFSPVFSGQSSDTAEVIARLASLRGSHDASSSAEDDGFAVEVVKRCIYLILDSTPRETETLTTLLSALELCGSISYADLQRGFAVMETRLADLALDHPRAGDILAGVLAWLVLDDAVDEGFLAWGASPAARFVRGAALASLTEGAPYILQIRSMHRDVVRRYFADGDAAALSAAVIGLNARHTASEAMVKLVQVRPWGGLGGPCAPTTHAHTHPAAGGPPRRPRGRGRGAGLALRARL